MSELDKIPPGIIEDLDPIRTKEDSERERNRIMRMVTILIGALVASLVISLIFNGYLLITQRQLADAQKKNTQANHQILDNLQSDSVDIQKSLTSAGHELQREITYLNAEQAWINEILRLNATRQGIQIPPPPQVPK